MDGDNISNITTGASSIKFVMILLHTTLLSGHTTVSSDIFQSRARTGLQCLHFFNIFLTQHVYYH